MSQIDERNSNEIHTGYLFGIIKFSRDLFVTSINFFREREKHVKV